ncbi:hypothetical protein LXL04_002481 [Taraxacum kok-saghyz]
MEVEILRSGSGEKDFFGKKERRTSDIYDVHTIEQTLLLTPLWSSMESYSFWSMYGVLLLLVKVWSLTPFGQWVVSYSFLGQGVESYSFFGQGMNALRLLFCT